MKNLFNILFITIFLCLITAITVTAEVETRFINGIPVTGEFDVALEVFDTKIVEIMKEHNIPAGTMAVMHDGQIVLSHGYGYSDKDRKIPTQPGTRMRIASITKSFTNAAIKHLISEGKVSLDEKVVDVLNIKPLGGNYYDPRWEDITISHLIYHKGGWDSQAAFDPMFSMKKISNEMGLNGLPSISDIAAFMMSQPLQYNPGEKYAYSNFGYALLGIIIEQVTGKSYYDYLYTVVLHPLGLEDVKPGYSLPEKRDSNEVGWYSDPFITQSLFDQRKDVYLPDGGFYLENLDANGRLIASTESLVKFAQVYWLKGEIRNPGEKQQWIHTGSLPGTASILLWRATGTNIAVIFNQRNNSTDVVPDGIGRNDYYQTITKKAISEAADSVSF
ncbi:serine hydrolase [Pelosinus sp. UFO1]|uniref:serine hydrolase domain-containing protein n=1 Tax=Pelosinus sp. UFO1 TaxID=484770 RepID=UPI0004D143B0|nr:serine hydrolase domain-containing protein [Pelosinus sp. UFO1]AIF50750.1 beta-lactamase [Pelosinus sp. UFO1]